MVGAQAGKWLLEFTSPNPGADDGDGRPWGDGTAMAQRAYEGRDPWDEGCKVLPMIGGDAAMIAIRTAFEAAIADAEAQEKRKVPAGQRGHVYIADWQFNALRDLSSDNPWGGKPWKKGEIPIKDQTALGLVVRMMSAGIVVRMLLWMPPTLEWLGVKALGDEHWNVAAAVQDHSDALQKKWPTDEPLGVVALDMRTAQPIVSTLHQKMIAVRVGAVNTAFCGGVDLAFNRRDFGLSGNKAVGIGDWQSGTLTPAPEEGWPQQSPPPAGGYPKFPYQPRGRFPEELPAKVYGATNIYWHDRQLQLWGPIVATVEQQFAERWILDCEGRAFLFKRSAFEYEPGNEVKLTSSACIVEGPGGNSVVPLPAAAPVKAAGDATVQLWRTIPLRAATKEPPFRRGEFTVMAGIAKAVSQATQLITICDQYFWSEPLARLLARRLSVAKGLKLLIILPPYGVTKSEDELGLRRRALKALWDGLDAGGRSRVLVFDMWRKTTTENRGVYVHAKAQTYDDELMACGSANLNRRSLECDAEIDCALLHKPTVQFHLASLYGCLTGTEWTDFKAGWLGRLWGEFMAGKSPALVRDPFFAETVGVPKTPNGVPMDHGMPWFPEAFEPTSIGPDVDDAVCQFASCPADPKARGRLDEVTFLLERCFEGDDWPWRKPNEDPLPDLLAGVEERLPRLIL
jgi:phosphatidylserine/phosphatidylglycerophosphate/cardiolipin synthase-like enzyme